jgi:hypothetical protein
LEHLGKSWNIWNIWNFFGTFGTFGTLEHPFWNIDKMFHFQKAKKYFENAQKEAS